MNAHQALKQARRRWGPLGFVLAQLDGEHLVGVNDGPRLHIAGRGASWVEAFADADRKETEHRSNHA